LLPTSFQPFGNSPDYLRITVEGLKEEERRKKEEGMRKRGETVSVDLTIDTLYFLWYCSGHKNRVLQKMLC
jgi:hypothetical protein